MTPASCLTDLTNFPVLINLSGNWLKTVGNGGNISSANGYDIIFRDENGLAKLDHEIEKYDGVNGALVAWVRIPTLHFNDSTNIYIYYGNSAVTSPTANASGVWNTSYGWAGVWHFHNDFLDSTPNHYDGTNSAIDQCDRKYCRRQGI